MHLQNRSKNQARLVMQENRMDYQHLALFESADEAWRAGYVSLGRYVSVHMRQFTLHSLLCVHNNLIVDFRGQQPEAGVSKKLSLAGLAKLSPLRYS